MGFGSTFGGPRYLTLSIEQVKRLEAAHGLSIETIIADGTGGGGNDPTITVSSLTFDDTTSTQTFTLTNNGSTPASVELSFSSLSGGQTLLVGQDYDGGDAISPTYVVDPDDGTRTVTLSRGGLTPSSPSSSETVTLTSNSGVTAGITCTIIPLAAFDGAVRDNVGTPTHEAVFENFSNTGTHGGTFGTNGSFAITASSEEPAFKGYGIPGSNGRLIQGSVDRSTWNRKTGTTRSWIWAWTNTQNMSGHRPFILDVLYGTNYGPGNIWTNSGTPYEVQFKYPTFNCTTAHSHRAPDGTITSGSEVLSATVNSMNVLAATWDGAGGITYRWKQAGHGSGFSFGTLSGVAAEPSTTLVTTYFAGYFNPANSIKFRYVGIVDGNITHDEFQTLTETAGL